MREGKNKPFGIVLVAPARRSRGGITEVVKAYESSSIWKDFNCKWLETHDDHNTFQKLIFVAKALIKAPWLFHKNRIIHFMAGQDVSFYRKTIFFLLAKILRKKTIIHIHAHDFEAFWYRKRPLNILIGRYVLEHADCVIAISDSWGQKVKYLCPKANVITILNPSFLNFDNITNVNSNVILYVGKLEKRKGFKDLIHAFRAVINQGIDANLVLAGNGQIEEAKELARSLGISDKVEITGWVDGQDKIELFRKASIFCLPSYSEGLPMALLEAMSFGLAAVSTPVGGIPDVIIQGKTGFIVKPGDVESLSEALQMLLSDNELRKTISTNARLSMKKFCIDNIVVQLGGLYKKLS